MKNSSGCVNFSLLLIITITMISFLIPSSQGDEEALPFGSTPWNMTKVVSVRVLVVIDKNLFVKYGINVNIKKYFMSYWKAVNEYVTLLQDPPVRIQIAKILNFETEYGKYASGVPLTGWASAKFILQQLNEDIEKTNILEKFDIAVLFTRWRLCTNFIEEKNGTRCGEFANAKLVLEYEHDIYHNVTMKGPVGVINDDGLTYQGIWDTLFLIGSYLGAPTDGSPGAEKCKPQDSYIMAPKPIWEKFKFQWSNCSITAIRNHLKYRTTTPLKNNVFQNTSMPGELVSLDHFCQITTKNAACFYDAQNCQALICKLKDSACIRDQIAPPAPEGSWCGIDKRCSFGICHPV